MIRSLLGSLFRARETALFLVLMLVFAGFSIFVEGFLDAFNLFERSRYWVVPG